MSLQAALQRGDWLSGLAVRMCTWVATVTLLLLAVLGAADVLSTWLLKSPVPSARELSSELLAVLIFFSFGQAQLKREHVGVDLLYARFSPGWQHVVTALALAMGLVIFAVLTWRLGAGAAASIEMQERAAALVSYPIYPFKVAVTVAAFVTTLEYLRQLLNHVLAGRQAQSPSRSDAAERAV
jgi:TRAP-type C4-dicarboxylate transport system permease small subunit